MVDRDLHERAAAVLERLRRAGLSVATAESCTGGLVAGALTAVAGSSDVVLGGVVSYSNGVKRSALGVRAETLDAVGAVSAEVAREMARGAAERLGADLGVSTTGIAGPGGATPTKPVGLVHLAACRPATGAMLERRVVLTGDRDAVRAGAVLAALDLLDALAGDGQSEAG